MTDIRALIAEGCAKLAAVDESPTTGRAFDLAEWAGLNARALLDALEDALEPSLGYAVLLKREPSGEARLGAYDIYDSSFDDQEAAEQSAMFWWSEADTCNVPVEYVVAELREVR